MSCFHPLKGFIVGKNSETGKDKIIVKPHEVEFIWHNGKMFYDSIDIPCGKCIGCRLEYSRQWANRMMMELEHHNSAYFITLTYSDDFVPKRPVTDENGVYLYDSLSLRKKDMSTFMKHLRKHFPDDEIRFFGCGEYGSKTLRPHYHLIVFGLHLDDLVVYKKTPLGEILYNSRSLEECWSNFIYRDKEGVSHYDKIGHVVIGSVDWASCAYVARYVTKKMTGCYGIWFENQNMEMPFSLMSRKPGIGFYWYRDHKGCMEKEFINLARPDKALKFKPPKYFESLYEEEFPDQAKQRKEKQKELAINYKNMVMNSIDTSYDEYLAQKEYNLKRKLRVLKREGV